MTIIKRANNAGKFRYGVRINGPDGTQQWLGTFSKLKEAKEFERKILSTPGWQKNETCDSFAERWVRDYPRQRVSTNNTNRNAVKKFLEDPQFIGLKMDDLDRVTAREWILKNRSSLPAVRAMFNDAVRDEICSKNPFENHRLTQSPGRKNLQPISVEEFDALCQCALEAHGEYGHEFRALIITAAFTLMRPGELFVLEWDDLDLDSEDPAILVRRTLSADRYIELPKNGKERRISLPPVVRDALMRIPRRPSQQRIFSTATGKRFSKSNFHYAWNPVRLAFGKPKMHFYELKHFGCTYYLDTLNMSASDVALQCGHTDGGILVMKLYGHPEAKKARARANEAWRNQGSDRPALRVVR